MAGWPRLVSSYAYQPAHPKVVQAIATMGSLCEDQGVPLAAAALQFSTRDSRIATTVVGAHTAEHVKQFVADSQLEISDSLFQELDSLAPPGDVWQDPPGSTWPR